MNPSRYTPEFEQAVMEWSRQRQGSKRFAHTIRVVETVTELAKRWSPDDVMVCRLAAWIHDAAKGQSDAELLSYAEKYAVPVRQVERDRPMLLHGIVAYLQADEAFQLDDDRIRTACAYHTTGSPDMNLVDKLLYVADLIEPARDFPQVEMLRELAMEDINETMILSIDGTLRYLLDRRVPIDPRVVELYTALIKQSAYQDL